MSKETTLKPCPFCGSEAHISGLGYRGAADCYDVKVICDMCNAQTGALTVDQYSLDVVATEGQAAAEVAAFWNRRT